MSSYSTKISASDGSLHPHPDEKNKQWQREFLMERLRSHCAQHKTFPELSKAMRMSMLEKRYALDAVEKSNLQKCLDSMQHCIKVTTRQGLIERLDSLSRQLGLKFMEDAAGLFIYSDMFFLEIILDPNDGKLKDVKVHHECKIEQQSCSELVTCLINGDFADFTNQLEGLSSIYQLNAEPKVKSKAFVALQAMEIDLYNLFKWKSYNKDIASLVIESPVGLAQKRRGGHPMKLIYFISPYDLINLETKSIIPLTLEYLKGKDIGMSVTVNLEASSTNKLQILPSVTFSSENNCPIYSPLNQNNSTLLPATFVLKLNKPLPVSDALMSIIGVSTKSEESQYLMSLAVQVASKGVIKNTAKGLFVTLPDQNHCYYFTENKKITGSVITNVPYTEPSQVPKILTALKHQALFFSLLSSCIRTGDKQCNLESTTILEVNALSIYMISVALQHPYDECMVSVEFDLSDIGNIKVQIYSLSNNYESANARLTKIVQTSLSIPITIRYLLKLWNQEQIKGFNRSSQDNSSFESGSLSGAMDHLNGQISRGPSGNLIGNDFQSNKLSRNGGGSGFSDTNSTFSQGQNRQFFHSINSGSNLNLVSNDLSNMGDGMTNSKNISNVTSGLVNQFHLKSENIKKEDFCESPKSDNQIKASDVDEKVFKLNKDAQNFKISGSDTSLGENDSVSKVTVSKPLNNSSLIIEKISTSGNKNSGCSNNVANSKAEKVQSTESWKKQSGSDSKNTVSITPVLTNSQSTDLVNVKAGVGSNSNNTLKSDKKSVIEIIPIKNNAVSNTISITPIQTKNSANISESSKSLFQTLAGSGNSNNTAAATSTGTKKKVDEKDSLKIEKKRRKKDGSSSSHSTNSKTYDNIELKIIEITGDGNTSTYRKLSDSSKTTSTSQKKQSLSNIPSSSSNNQNSSSSSSKKISTKSYPNSSNSKSPLSFGSSSGSPKNKHNLTSGKPSLTTLKSATNVSDSKESFSLIKLNQQISDTNQQNPYDIFDIEESDVFDFTTSADYMSSFPSPQSRIRKSSLTAVIDKLNKQVKNCVTDEIGEKLEKMHKEAHHLQPTNLNIEEINSKSNPEYMIKPSSDGMKLTINKTKTDSSYKRDKPSDSPRSGNSSPNIKKHFGILSGGSNSNPGSSSPKKHTGLKPGVSSGPASKKSLEKLQNPKSKNTGLSKSNSSDCLTAKPSGNSTPKSNLLSKSLSSNSLSSDSSVSSVGSSSSSVRKEKTYSSKNKSFNNSTNSNRSISDQQDSTTMKLLQFSSNKNIMEGFIKSLDTNFQIPKLSQKVTVPSTTSTTTINSLPVALPSQNIAATVSGENSSKRNNGQDPVKNLPNNVMNNSASNITFQKIDKKKTNLDKPSNLSEFNHIPSDLMRKDLKITRKPNPQQNFSDIFVNNLQKTSPPLTASATTSTKLLDKMNQSFARTPGISVRLLKSPVPSSVSAALPVASNIRITNSPCLSTEDEIMDEGLLGVNSK
ncbi:mediator of RNA polymerase II transcription subunit 1 [Condylostylus longicornis]|uniref:mediator of RNA polymerase II transcription subunit 1 n=1 Tax=Condylostylus longicornis TaxID=2530218 RepID=UPI00244DA0F9|nr:mediator of RNA polymerase II transcription subunit 1 [Condylostylus longicornis]